MMCPSGHEGHAMKTSKFTEEQSLIGTCKLNGINPRAYLEYVLTHIGDHKISRIEELLPWALSRWRVWSRKMMR